MPLEDLEQVCKDAIRSIINNQSAGRMFTFNGLAEALVQSGWNSEDSDNKARSLGRIIKSSVQMKGRDSPLTIVFAKIYSYPRLRDGQMDEDDPVLHPWRDTDTNAIVYQKLDRQMGEF